MRMFVISDNVDTTTGLRFAGVEGVVAHQKEEIEEAINMVLKQRDIGILLITEKLEKLVPQQLSDIKLNYKTPLVVVIPDRHGTGRTPDFITGYVRDAIGLKIWGVNVWE